MGKRKPPQCGAFARETHSLLLLFPVSVLVFVFFFLIFSVCFFFLFFYSIISENSINFVNFNQRQHSGTTYMETYFFVAFQDEKVESFRSYQFVYAVEFD